MFKASSTAIVKSSMRNLGAGLLVALLVAGCGGDSDPTPVANAGDVVAVADTTVTGASFAAMSQVMTYRMPGVDGSLVESNAVVMIPTGTAPTGGWEIVGWGHGTTGVADACAPSRDPTLSQYDTYLDLLLQANFAVVAPDYEGLGTPGVHPYLNLDSEGRSLLYAIDAAVKQYPSLSSRYALLGHSQGGHAVLGAAELATANETPNITLKSVIALAPASQTAANGDQLISAIINPIVPYNNRVTAGVGWLSFSALILAGVEATDPSFDFGSTLTAQGAFIEPLTLDQCLDTIRTDITVPIQTAITNDGNLNSLITPNSSQIPAVAQYLSKQEPGFRLINAPIKLIQGGVDTTVPVSATTLLEDEMRRTGITSAVLRIYATDGHTSILNSSASEVINTLATDFLAGQ